MSNTTKERDGVLPETGLGGHLALVFSMSYVASSLVASQTVTLIGIVLPVAVLFIVGMALSRVEAFKQGKALIGLMLLVTISAVAIGVSGITANLQ